MPVGQDCDELLVSALKRESLDSVEGAFAYDSGEDLNKPNLQHRRRTRLSVADDKGRVHELYLKRYGQEKLKDKLKRIFTYGWNSSPARTEFENIRSARKAGVLTMREVFCDEQRGFLGTKRSCIIVTAVPGDALERCGEEFLSTFSDDAAATAAFTNQLAILVRKLHGAGFVHRDLYASHVFLDNSSGGVQLYLIDLARMFAPKCPWRRFRWKVKDLAQLKFSMPKSWVEDCWGQFLVTYLGKEDASRFGRYNCAIDRKVSFMHHRAKRKV